MLSNTRHTKVTDKTGWNNPEEVGEEEKKNKSKTQSNCLVHLSIDADAFACATLNCACASTFYGISDIRTLVRRHIRSVNADSNCVAGHTNCHTACTWKYYYWMRLLLLLSPPPWQTLVTLFEAMYVRASHFLFSEPIDLVAIWL